VFLESENKTKNFDSPLDYFVYLTAGKPIIYGICLQKQHLDGSRSQKKLEINNGYRPFLYRFLFYIFFLFFFFQLFFLKNFLSFIFCI
jgi:hypothetical protein